MVTDTPIKIQIVKSLSNLKPSRMIAVKADNESSFSLYVTDRNGVPYPLKDLQGLNGITNTDGNLVITGADNKVINLAPALLSVINSALQSGDNISELLNDAGYITSADLPTKTSDLINDGSDATSTYVETDELGTTAFSNDYNDLDNLPVIPTIITNHSELTLNDGTNPHGTTKTDVGLGNVDNTSDIDKPISTATQIALNSKQDIVNVISSNTTASNDQKYHVVSNATFTDPSPIEGRGYEVFVRNGTATIGGIGYPVGSYVFRTYHSGSWGSQLIGGGTTKKTENLFFQDAVGSTVRTITADQKNMHQSRYLANASPFGQLGLTLGNGVAETSGVLNLSYLSDVMTPQITGDYVGKVKKIVFSYSRNVNESSANTNVMIRLMGETKYQTDMQLIAEHNLVSTTTLANAEHKVEIPVLTHLPLSAFSNIGWCIRSNNATAQQFTRIKINVIVEEV